MYTHTHIQAEQTAGGMAVARGARVQQRPGLCSRGLRGRGLSSHAGTEGREEGGDRGFARRRRMRRRRRAAEEGGKRKRRKRRKEEEEGDRGFA